MEPPVASPITGRNHRTACVRFKATSGFRFAIDPSAYALTAQKSLKVEQNVASLDANGLTVKFQLGPCINSSLGSGLARAPVQTCGGAKGR